MVYFMLDICIINDKFQLATNKQKINLGAV